MHFSSTSTSSALKRSLVIGATTSALVLGALTAIPAQAAIASCDLVPDAILIEDGVCEITFTEDAVWTPPSNISELYALLVGGGGAGYYAVDPTDPQDQNFAYGGGGGEVKLATLSPTGDVTIVVGAGGQVSSDPGGPSSVSQAAVTTDAQGGGNADNLHAGISGSEYDGSSITASGDTVTAIFGGGGGAAADAPSTDGLEGMGGDGVTISSLSGASATLFAHDDNCYGGGGGVIAASYDWVDAYWSTSVCGGGAASIENDSPFTWVEYSTRPNSGGGGAAVFLDGNGSTTPIVHSNQSGADGVVVLRFDVQKLPKTGSDSHSVLLMGVMALGAGFLTGALSFFSRRRKVI